MSQRKVRLLCVIAFSQDQLTSTLLASVVQKVDSDIPRKNHYPVDNAIGFPNTCPLDNLTGG